MDLSAIFGKFAGREVPLVAVPFTALIAGSFINGTLYELADPEDPTIAALKQTAQDHGLSLRIWWPGVVFALNDCPTRVNITLERDAQAAWRIAPDFTRQ